MSLIGHVGTASRSLVTGWAADAGRPERAVPVHVTIGGKHMRLVADQARKDLQGIFPNATGRYAFRYDAEPFPLSPFVTHDICVTFAETGAPLPGGALHIPAVGSPLPEGARNGRPAPLVVTTMGRSGSSLLMAELAKHPDILVARNHPYEVKLLSYYAYMLRTLVSEANREKSTDPNTMGAPANQFTIGFNPFNDAHDARDPAFLHYWSRTAPDALRATVSGLIDAYYENVALRTGKRQPRFFAEKIDTGHVVRQAASFMFGGGCEILLVRDPRDVVCSAMAFWKRDFEAAVRSVRGHFARMAARREEAGLVQHVLRYEDLLASRRATMAALLAFLGLRDEPADLTPAADPAIFAAHGTSTTPERTIGRWRTDLTPTEQAACLPALLPFIEQFGYAPD